MRGPAGPRRRGRLQSSRELQIADLADDQSTDEFKVVEFVRLATTSDLRDRPISLIYPTNVLFAFGLYRAGGATPRSFARTELRLTCTGAQATAKDPPTTACSEGPVASLTCSRSVRERSASGVT